MELILKINCFFPTVFWEVSLHVLRRKASWAQISLVEGLYYNPLLESLRSTPEYKREWKFLSLQRTFSHISCIIWPQTLFYRAPLSAEETGALQSKQKMPWLSQECCRPASAEGAGWAPDAGDGQTAAAGKVEFGLRHTDRMRGLVRGPPGPQTDAYPQKLYGGRCPEMLLGLCLYISRRAVSRRSGQQWRQASKESPVVAGPSSSPGREESWAHSPARWATPPFPFRAPPAAEE